MRKRMLWTLMLLSIAMLILLPINSYLINTSLDKVEDTRRANFTSLMFIEAIMIFIAIFMVVDSYFTKYPDETTILPHKIVDDPNIPRKYYQDVETNERKESDIPKNGVDE